MGDAGRKTKPQTRGSSSPWMPRLRKRGEKLLHSKYVVIIVIILTIVDCSLVIAELILDLYSVKKTLSASEGQTFKFIRSIRSKYKEDVSANESIASVLERITHSTILWNSSKSLDFQCRCYNLETEFTTTSTAGMSFVSYASLSTLDNRKEDFLGTHARPVPIHQGKNLIFSNHRLRREHASNTASNLRNFKQNNDLEIRKSLQDIFQKHLTRLRRYLPKSIQSLNEYISNNVSLQYDDNDNRRINNHDNHFNNDHRNKNATFSLGDALIEIHRQLTDYVPMHLSQSGSQDSEQSKLWTPISSSNDVNNDENVIDVDVVNNVNSGSFLHNDAEGGNDPPVHIPRDSGHTSVTYSPVSYPGYENDADTFRYDNDQDGYRKPIQRSKRQMHDNDDDDDEANMRKELHHSKEMEIAHKLHYASVCVVSILVIEVTMKIVCAGSHFLKRKIEVFDAVVIVTSVVVDLIFIKGLSDFAIDDSIFVLAVLLPWRVIRVVNSLVMAVIDHEHVKLRLLYSRKKKLDKTVDSLRNEVDELKGMLQDIRSFCLKEGIDPSRIDGMLGKFAPRRRKDSKFYTLVKLVMSTASINNNDNDSVSSSSIENDLRHYTNRDSVLNEVASNDGTITSLKRYLSVPFSNGDSRSASEAESIAGDQANTSPSIYITSPASENGRGMFTFSDVEIGNNGHVNFPDPHECIEEEDSVATIDVTSSTTNANTTNGVAFYIGSQTLFNFGLSQGTTAPTEDDGTNNQCFYDSSFSNALRENASSSFLDNYRSIYSQHFGQYLTVPRCTVNVSAVTNTISTGNNFTTNSADSTSVTSAIPLSPPGSNELRRSASDNVSVTFGLSPYEGLSSLIRYGSPIPARRLPEVRTRRKNYTRYKSESDDNDHVGLLKRDFKPRLRRHSGEPHAAGPGGCREEPKRARSHSPSPMTLLSVPGNNILAGGDITCSSSRSMNDVSSAGNPYAHSLGGEGKILRRSCLSLNSEGRKRRGKSPHRVSFKVS